MTGQVEDINVLKDYSRDTFYSLSPLTWLLKLFAINCNVKNVAIVKTLYISRSFVTMVILGSLNLYSLYYKIRNHRIISTSIKLTDDVQMIYDSCQYAVDLCFVYKYGRYLSLEYFRQYEYIDRILGMTYYSEIKWKLIRLLGTYTLIWATSSACDFAAWFISYGWITATLYSIAYVYLYVKILTTLDLSSHVMHIEVRLKIIGDLVQQYYTVTEPSPGFIGDLISNKNWLYSDASLRTLELKSHSHPLKLMSNDDFVEIKWLCRCYLLLTEQVEFINRMFGFRILLNSLSLLVDIIKFTNTAVRLVLETQDTTFDAAYFPVVSSLMRQMTCVLVLISLVNHCEKAYSERDRIINIIDHLLINKNPNEKLTAAMTELRGLVQARPISFNMAKFFRLDNDWLVSVTSVVVTYTIILLQSMN